MLRWPTFLITVLCGGLWWYALVIPLLSSVWAQVSLLLAAGVCGLLFVYSVVGPMLAYVRCFPNYFLIRTPLYRLAISYRRILDSRLTQFNPGKLRWTQQDFLEPFIGTTVVAINLKGYPLNEKWLRLWFTEFMFQGESTGFIFHVKDWTGLSREVDTYRSQWQAEHRQT